MFKRSYNIHQNDKGYEASQVVTGIDPDDIYNFDETGFVMGLTATVKVIIRAEYYGWRSLLQPGNCEWVTVIECIM